MSLLASFSAEITETRTVDEVFRLSDSFARVCIIFSVDSEISVCSEPGAALGRKGGDGNTRCCRGLHVFMSESPKLTKILQ